MTRVCCSLVKISILDTPEDVSRMGSDASETSSLVIGFSPEDLEVCDVMCVLSTLSDNIS